MKTKTLPKDAVLTDYITLPALTKEIGMSYGSLYYRILKDEITVYLIKGQKRPLFVRRIKGMAICP